MEKFEEFPSVNINFSQLIRDNVEEALSGVKGANSIKLFGNDLDVLERAGQRVINILNNVRGISNPGLFHIVGQPNLEIQIDRHECARYGINVSDVEAVVQVAVGGRAFTRMVEGEKLFDIVLRLPKGQRDDPEVIGRIPVDTTGPDGKPGARIPLSQLVHIEAHKPGAAYIYRENNRRYIPIKFSVKDRDLASTIAEAQGKVTDPKTGAQLPPGYDIDWSGEFQQMEEANDRLMWIVPISIGLIISLLYTAFNSIKDALLVMVNVVEASMGGILALWLTGTPFSISAAVGFVSVFGVAVQDGVLLDLVLQSIARRGPAGARIGDARRRAARAPGGDDLAHRRAGPVSGRHRDLDRLAGPEAAGDRGRRGDALHAVPDALPDAGALQLLPGPRRPRRMQERPDPGLALYRPVPSSGQVARAMPPATRSRRTPTTNRPPSTMASESHQS